MIVTTTNSIDGRDNSPYDDSIAANGRTDVTVYSDIGASYVDFFGLYKLIEIIIYWNILIPMRNVTFDL